MNHKKAIHYFLFLTFLFSMPCYYLINGGGASASGMVAILMWCPGISAIIVQKKYYKNEKILGLTTGKFSDNFLGFVIPLAYLAISYAIYWLTFDQSLNQTYDFDSIILLVSMFLSSIVTALGEEIGWRGFLLPQLCRHYSLLKSAIISGAIWAVWHYPLMIAGKYNAGTPLPYQLSVFTVEVILISVILAILRMKSNSVWPAVILHASHNFFDQVIFEPVTNGLNKAYFVGETGMITLVCILIVMLMLYVTVEKSSSFQQHKLKHNYTALLMIVCTSIGTLAAVILELNLALLGFAGTCTGLLLGILIGER